MSDPVPAARPDRLGDVDPTDWMNIVADIRRPLEATIRSLEARLAELESATRILARMADEEWGHTFVDNFEVAGATAEDQAVIAAFLAVGEPPRE